MTECESDLHDHAAGGEVIPIESTADPYECNDSVQSECWRRLFGSCWHQPC